MVWDGCEAWAEEREEDQVEGLISTRLRWGFLNCFHCSLSKKTHLVKSSTYEHVVVSVRKKKKHYLYAHEQQIISGLLVPVRATASWRKQTHRERPPEGHLPNLALLLAAPHVSTSKRRTALTALTHTHTHTKITITAHYPVFRGLQRLIECCTRYKCIIKQS